MSNITASTDFSQVKDEDLTKFLELFAKDVVEKVNGKLEFTTNLGCKLVTAPFTTANAELAVEHGLGRVPIGRLVYGQTAAGSVYDSTRPNTTSTIYLKCNTISTVKLIVF